MENTKACEQDCKIECENKKNCNNCHFNLHLIKRLYPKGVLEWTNPNKTLARLVSSNIMFIALKSYKMGALQFITYTIIMSVLSSTIYEYFGYKDEEDSNNNNECCHAKKCENKPNLFNFIKVNKNYIINSNNNIVTF